MKEKFEDINFRESSRALTATYEYWSDVSDFALSLARGDSLAQDEDDSN